MGYLHEYYSPILSTSIDERPKVFEKASLKEAMVNCDKIAHLSAYNC